MAEDGEVGDPPATVPLGTTVHINLARALRLAGRYAEAATLYDRLDRRGELQGYAEELCSFALALDQQGQVDDAVRVLDGVIYDEEASPQVGVGLLDTGLAGSVSLYLLMSNALFELALYFADPYKQHIGKLKLVQRAKRLWPPP